MNQKPILTPKYLGILAGLVIVGIGVFSTLQPKSKDEVLGSQSQETDALLLDSTTPKQDPLKEKTVLDILNEKAPEQVIKNTNPQNPNPTNKTISNPQEQPAEQIKTKGLLQQKTVDIVSFNAYEIEGPDRSFVVKTRVNDAEEGPDSVTSSIPRWTPFNELMDFVDGKLYLVNGGKEIIEVYTTTNAGLAYKDAIKLPEREKSGIAYAIGCESAPECIIKTTFDAETFCTMKLNIKSKKTFDPTCNKELPE